MPRPLRPLPPARVARRTELLPLGIVGTLCALAFGLWLARSAAAPTADESPPATPLPAPMAPAAPVVPEVAPLEAAELARAREESGRMVLDRPGGTLELTLEPGLQREVGQLLAATRVPYAAVVLMDPRTGALQAAVEHRQPDDPVGAIGGLTAASVPAASVFKVVSSAALLLDGETPETRVCFHGGRHGIDASHLRADPRDRQCQTLTEALARSTNAAFARLVLEHLAPGELAKTARQLGFGAALAGDLRMQASAVDEGTTELDRARCAPGFAGSTLSPLHGAWLAAAVANGGVAMQPRVVTRDLRHPERAREPVSAGQVLPPEVAAGLGQMMAETVASGTGRHAFAQRPPALRGMAVAAKSGSLSGREGPLYRHFSWFVGFAPADEPRIAFAVLAINGEKWRAKAPTLARDALGIYFGQSQQTALAQP